MPKCWRFETIGDRSLTHHMQVTIGANPEKPLLEAQLTHQAVEVLMGRPGFAELRASFTSPGGNKDIRQSQTNDHETYSLLAKRIGKRPQQAHEQHLRPFVRLLEWGCIVKDSEDAVTTSLQEIESQPSLSGEYHVETRVLWPQTQDEQVIEFATTAMQQFGKQLRFGAYNQPSKYDCEIGLTYRQKIKRLTDEDEHVREGFSTVDIHTFASSYPRARGAFCDKDYFFEIAGNRLKSHTEQLIYLVGVTAIGCADQFASS